MRNAGVFDFRNPKPAVIQTLLVMMIRFYEIKVFYVLKHKKQNKNKNGL